MSTEKWTPNRARVGQAIRKRWAELGLPQLAAVCYGIRERLIGALERDTSGLPWLKASA